MIAYKISPTIEGIFCALFESFTIKEIPQIIFSGDFQPSFDCKIKTIKNIDENVLRVKKGIIKNGGISLLSAIFYVFRSSDELKETIIFNAARKCLSARKNLLDDYKDPDILAFYELKTKISFEAHRMLGFVRFEKSKGGVWYANISPDNNIVDLLAPHFNKRFPKEKFVLHDDKRHLLCICDGKNTMTFKSQEPITVYLDDDEVEFQNLWRVYFNSVSIKERKNQRLQDNYLPRRYRKRMTEFLDDVNNEILSQALDCKE